MPRITPNLWFDTEGEEAANYYVSIFPNSWINKVTHYGEASPREAGLVLTVEFSLGQPFTAINGVPDFAFDEAISFLIPCKDQDEVDYYWNRLLEGGQPSQCGWLKDKYGLSWQAVPTVLEDMMSDPDRDKAEPAMKAMLGMVKLDIAELQRAYDGSTELP